MNRAPGTGGNLATLAAYHHTAVAPAVEKENALFPPPEVFLQFFPQQAGQARGVSLPEFLLHIHQAHFRHLVGIVSLPEGKQVILSHLRGIPALHRRGRRPQQKQSLMVGAAELGHLPGVVTDHALRLIAALLLLVQDDQAHVFQRGEDGGPGAQHHLDLAPADTLPLVVALRHPQGAVEHGHLVPKTGGEPPHHLGRQHDLRHQDHGPPPPAQYFLNQTEIDLGLAAAGDALEQHRLRLPGLRQGPDRLKGRLLFLIEDDRTAGFHRRQVRQPQLLFR